MARYEPQLPNFDFEDEDTFRRYLAEEFRNIAAALLEVDGVLLPELHVEPSKPRNGMIVLADGSDWNPGSGAGFYGYSASAWVLLG